MDGTARGYMLTASHAFIGNTYDEATSKKIETSIDPRVREAIRNAEKAAWYPVSDVAEIFRAIAVHHDQTDGKSRAALESVGRAIGDMATNSFLKFILRVLSTSMFASKMPDFWRRDHRIGDLAAENYDPAHKRMLVTLRGVKGYDYIGPVAPGFVLYAFERLGATNVRVDYEWSPTQPAGDAFAYTFTWD